MKFKILFVTIILLAFFLRFYKLSQIPSSLDWDEASNAYNAYSILKTARDQYGSFLPVTNRSFDDYKPPLYMYLNVPTIAIFGLTPLAARLPSAIFGFLTIPLVYFLTKKLFRDRNIALLAMFLLAISPWHIQFSRVGFEANVGLFMATSAICTFLYGIKNKKLLILSGILIGASFYSYHTERIFVPLIFIVILALWRKEIFSLSKKYLLSFVIIAVAVALPLIIFIPPQVILQRFETTTSGSKLENVEKSIRYINQDGNTGVAKIIHNRRIIIAETYIANYLSHFDFNFLFTKGDDNFRHHVEGIGMLYLFELPLVFYGAYCLIRGKTKAGAFIIFWLLLAPIAASPASPAPHAVRSLPEVIPLEIISAYGLYKLATKKLFAQKFILPVFYIWIAASFLIYQENYWIQYPDKFASFWQFGYKEAVQESAKIKNQYQKINVDRSLEQAYIFWLFTTKYDPKSYQTTGSRNHFDKYYFEAKPPTQANELFISDAKIFPQSFEVVKVIYYPDATEAIKIGHPR